MVEQEDMNKVKKEALDKLRAHNANEELRSKHIAAKWAKEEMNHISDDVPGIDDGHALALKKMIWTNTTVSFWCMITCWIVFAMVVLKHWLFQGVAFIVIGAIGSAYWLKWDGKIKQYLR